MKIKYLFFLLFLVVSCGSEQSGTESNESEKDSKKISPFAEAKIKIKDTNINIKYSAPSVRERDVWGNLVPYGLVWRTGADEATVFETSQPILIEGKRLEKGKYAFFTIPEEGEWTIILNEEHDQWGAFNYEEERDALRVKAKPVTVANHTEQMKFTLLETGEDRGEIKLAWDKLQLPISFQVLPSKG